MLLDKLQEKGLIKPPDWLISNTHYLTIMGSNAYGYSASNSDLDIYGFCIPKKEMVFPHLAGHIQGFGKQQQKFDEFQQHHIFDQEANKGKGQEFDITVFGIVKYFQLLMDNNPNVIDSLFVRLEEILHISQVGNLVRDNRKLFLHKGSWHRFKGYAFSQWKKIRDLNRVESKRKAIIDAYGYDVKFGSHLVRLLLEVEQILTEYDLDLKRNSDILKSIRRGEWTLEQLESWFFAKEKSLEVVYNESKLPWGPNEDAIKELLLKCLEHHYGNLEKAITVPKRESEVLKQIAQLSRDWWL